MLRAGNIKSFLRGAPVTIPYGLLRIISIIIRFVQPFEGDSSFEYVGVSGGSRLWTYQIRFYINYL